MKGHVPQIYYTMIYPEGNPLNTLTYRIYRRCVIVSFMLGSTSDFKALQFIISSEAPPRPTGKVSELKG